MCVKALKSVPFKDPILFARVDMLRDNEGEWVLNELEMIEPSLFFRVKPGSSDVFVKAIIDTIKGVKPTQIKPVKKNGWNFFWLYVLLQPIIAYI
jgi:hypothetical protein